MTMEVLVSRGCGLDVHQATVVACLLTGEPGRLPRKQVKTFSTMTSGLIELRDWLKADGCTAVAMEATGVYWKPVYTILEGHFELVVANARHIKAVPGRKTDVKMPSGSPTCCATDCCNRVTSRHPSCGSYDRCCATGSSWSTPDQVSATASSSCWRAPTSKSRASFRTSSASRGG